MMKYWMVIASFTLNNGEKLEAQVSVGNERQCVTSPVFREVELPFQGHDERQRMYPTAMYCRFVGVGAKPWGSAPWELYETGISRYRFDFPGTSTRGLTGTFERPKSRPDSFKLLQTIKK
jgi:hypothetical protein